MGGGGAYHGGGGGACDAATRHHVSASVPDELKNRTYRTMCSQTTETPKCPKYSIVLVSKINPENLAKYIWYVYSLRNPGNRNACSRRLNSLGTCFRNSALECCID